MKNDDTLTLPRRPVEERYYVSEEEALAIKRAAYVQGMSKSEYVRRMIVPRAQKDAARAA